MLSATTRARRLSKREELISPAGAAGDRVGAVGRTGPDVRTRRKETYEGWTGGRFLTQLRHAATKDDAAQQSSARGIETSPALMLRATPAASNEVEFYTGGPNKFPRFLAKIVPRNRSDEFVANAVPLRPPDLR
jgi:hypothetical protein